MASPGIWIALLLTMNLFWSGSYAVVKVGLNTIDPVVLVFFRLALALIIMIAIVASRRPSLQICFWDGVRIVGAGVLLAISNVLWVTGIGLSQATDASLLYVFEPVWGILLASIFLKEKLRISAIAGLVLAMLGLLKLSGFHLSDGNLFETGQGIGNMMVVVGLLAESFFSILLKPVSQRVAAPVVTTGVLGTAVIALAPPAILRQGFASVPPLEGLLSIAYLAIICTVVGYTLWIAVMRHVPVGVMLFTVFLQPLAGPVIAFAFLHESIDTRVLSGGMLLLLAMFIAVVGHIRATKREKITFCPDTVSATADI